MPRRLRDAASAEGAATPRRQSMPGTLFSRRSPEPAEYAASREEGALRAHQGMSAPPHHLSLPRHAESCCRCYTPVTLRRHHDGDSDGQVRLNTSTLQPPAAAMLPSAATPRRLQQRRLHSVIGSVRRCRPAPVAGCATEAAASPLPPHA